MARPKVRIEPPTWFARSHYAAADRMDAADWYLNLSLRGAIARGKCKFGREYVRGSTPIILRRAEEWPAALAFIRDELGGDFATIFDGKEPRAGVENLRAEELYFFEQRLPHTIRQFGRSYVAGKTPVCKAPPGFSGPVDDLFEPRLLNLFVRIDLSRPTRRYTTTCKLSWIASGARSPRSAVNSLTAKRCLCSEK